MNSYSYTGIGDSRSGIWVSASAEKNAPFNQKKGDRILRMEMYHKGTLHGGALH